MYDSFHGHLGAVVIQDILGAEVTRAGRCGLALSLPLPHIEVRIDVARARLRKGTLLDKRSTATCRAHVAVGLSHAYTCGRRLFFCECPRPPEMALAYKLSAVLCEGELLAEGWLAAYNRHDRAVVASNMLMWSGMEATAGI